MHRGMERNVRLYYRFRFAQNMLIIGPVLVPYMLFKGLSYAEILTLQSLSAVAVVLFEVPTGVVADRLSRKLSLVLSSILMGVGLAMYIVFEGFLLFAMAELLFGLGMTFSSGADSAMLYESLERLGRKSEYSTIEAKVMANIYVGQAVGSIASSLLYTVCPYIPLWISVGMLLLSSLISGMFTEPEGKAKSNRSYFAHVIKCFGNTFSVPRIRWAIYYAALMGVMLRASFWLYEPYFRVIRLDIALFGIVFAFFNLVSAFSSRYLVKVVKDQRPRKVLTGLGFMMAGAYFLPLLSLGYWAIALLALGQVVRGMYMPVMRFYINNQIEDEFRATVLSIVSLSASLSFAVFSPLIGLGLDRGGAVPVYFTMGVATVAGSVLLWQIRRFQKYKRLRGYPVR